MKLKQLNTFFLRCQFLASERHNLHDDLFLIDPPVVSFDGESQLNVLLYGSDGFNDKINKEIVLRIIPDRADNTGVAEGAHGRPIFLCSKNKKWKQTEEFQSRTQQTFVLMKMYRRRLEDVFSVTFFCCKTS